MEKESQRKILGAFVVGLALVAGAYTVANFAGPSYTQPASVVQPTAAPRTAIDVSDNDNNGIEDWREEFVTAEPVIINETVSGEYTTPDTLTGQTGINFFENVLQARIYAQNPNASEQIINDTIATLESETSGILYDLRDINVITNWDESDIKSYANVMGNSLTANSPEGLENELSILNGILARGEVERISELERIATYYKTLTDKALSTPVPSIFVKEHLDLINTYHALYLDIDAMTQALEDPVVSLVRMRKYRDDTLGLQLALENMYMSLLPYESLFTNTDAALAFTLFIPRQRI